MRSMQNVLVKPHVIYQTFPTNILATDGRPWFSTVPCEQNAQIGRWQIGNGHGEAAMWSQRVERSMPDLQARRVTRDRLASVSFSQQRQKRTRRLRAHSPQAVLVNNALVSA
jgi:hypothetical protein